MKAQNNEISVSEFKKHCLQMLQEINTTGKSITLTKRSIPIANVVPFSASSDKQTKSYFGILKNTITIKGDIENFSTESEWGINNE